MSDIVFQKPDGSVVVVDSSEASAAEEMGYVQTTREKAEASASPIRAGIEGVVRGAIPVLGRNLVSRASSEFENLPLEEAQAGQTLREEENPMADMLGTGVGFAVGPGKLLGGATAGMRAASLTGRAAAGAAEGGLMGLTEAIDESMLDNVPLSAENIAAQTMAGAFSGGALDFGMGAIGKGVKLAVKKAGGEAVRETLKELGDQAVTKQLFGKSDLKKYGTDDNLKDILKFGRDEGIVTTGSTVDSVAKAATEAVEKRKPMYDLILDGLEGVSPAQARAPEVIEDVTKALKQYDRGLLAPQAKSVLDEITAVASQPGVTWRELHNMQSDMFLSLPASGEVNSLSRRKVLQSAQEALTASLKGKIDDGLAAVSKSGQMAPELEAMGLGSGTALKDLSREYYLAKRLQSAAVDRAQAQAAAGVSLPELLAGASVASGSLEGAATGLASAAVTRAVKQRGGFVLGGALHALADSNTLDNVAKAFHSRTMKMLNMAPELLGSFRGVIEQAASQGAGDLLKTHVELANSNRSDEYLSTMGLSPETDEQVSAAGGRLAAIDAVQRAAKQQDVLMDDAISGMFLRKKSTTPKISGSNVKNFEKTIGDIRNVIRNAENLYMNIPADLQNGAPSTTGTIASTVVNAAKFLDSKAPKNPYEGMPGSVAPQWQPNQVDLDRFNRYKEAVEAPAKALQNMAAGYISPEQVEAIKAVYPAMYTQLQEKISERLMMAKDPLNYKQKLAISAIVGPGALGMSQQQQQIIQSSMSGASPQDAQGGMKAPDGRQKVDQEKNIQTQAQRLEAR